jgi:hypothetical protein
VGIASEPKPQVNERLGSSEDLIYAESAEWTAELLAELDDLKNLFGIDQVGNQRFWAIDDQEFPEVAHSTEPRVSRRQRRAIVSERRRQRRKQRT